MRTTSTRLPDFSGVEVDNGEVQGYENDGDPINARIYVGHYEARASPLTNTDPTTMGPINLDDTAKFAPAKYEFVAHAPGCPGVLRPQSPFGALALEEEPDDRDRVPDQLGLGHVGGDCDDAERRGDSRRAHRRHRARSGQRTRTTSALRRRGISRWTASRRRSTSQAQAVHVRYVQVSARIGPGSGRFAPVRQFDALGVLQ